MHVKIYYRYGLFFLFKFARIWSYLNSGQCSRDRYIRKRRARNFCKPQIRSDYSSCLTHRNTSPTKPYHHSFWQFQACGSFFRSRREDQVFHLAEWFFVDTFIGNLASSMLQIIEIECWPLCQNENHLIQVLRKEIQIRAISWWHDYRVEILCQGGCVADELAISLVEFRLYTERTPCVDLVTEDRSIAIFFVGVYEDIGYARRLFIAILLEDTVWAIATASWNLEAVHVCLHNVKFRAPASSITDTIAVPERV